MLAQVACGRANQSMQSVAKRSPRSHPIHVTPHLTTIEEEDVEMAGQSPAGDIQMQPVGGSHTDGEVEIPDSVQNLEPRGPLPEDVQQAEDFQVSCA